MARARCRECGKEVSTEATTCPHCGCPAPAPTAPERAETRTGALVLTGIAAVIIAVTTCNRQTKPVTPTSVAKSATPSASLPLPAAPAAPAPTPTPKELKARADVAKIKAEQFCSVLGKTIRATAAKPNEYREAMIERAMQHEHMTWEMIAGIELKQPVLGMDACGVIAALGKPDRSNRSVGKFGEHHQLVYSDRGLYVYLDNYKVTSWQD